MTNRRAPFTGSTVQSGVPPTPSTSFAGPIYANEAAASAAGGLADGQQVFILSHRSIWTSAPNSTVALTAHEVIARNGGGRLMRDLTYSDPAWRTLITDVYVDPTNSTGVASDENQAIFNAAKAGNARLPLLTLRELSRRFGRRNTITGDPIAFTFQIHMISSSSGTDYFDFDCILGTDTTPRILGEAPTVVLASVALVSFTAQNPATNTACQINVAAQNWAAFLGKRVRRTSDGSVATILKDLGGGTARISQPQLTNEASFATTPTNVNWAAGNNIVVEDLTVLQVAHWSIGTDGSASGFAGEVNILDCNITSKQGAGTTQFWFPETTDGTVIICYQCVFTSPFDFATQLIANGCTLRGGFYSDISGSKAAMYGGAVYGPTCIVPFVNVNDSGDSGAGSVGFSAYFQGAAVQFRHAGMVGLFSIWDAPVAGAINPNGHGMLVGGGPGSDDGIGLVDIQGGTASPFGSGQAAKGIRMAAGSRLVYQTTPTCTGATGDFQLADSAVGWWWGAGIYNPVGAGINLTWANLAAAKGGAGFGGGAHELDKDAHIQLAAVS